MKLRMTQAHFEQVRRVTADSFVSAVRFPPETGCILLLSLNDHPGNPALLVAEVLPPKPGELTEQADDGLVFSPGYLRRALFAVRERGLAGFLTVHTHPLANQSVAFSRYDDANDPQLMSNLYELQPGASFGSMVLGKSSAAARLWPESGGVPLPLGEWVIVGDQVEVFPLNGDPVGPEPQAAEIFARARALTGDGALARLSRMRVGVVGASGTGSLAVELLLRAGVGEILIFDFDHAEPSNLNRVLHLRVTEAELHTLKADRLASVCGESGLPTRVISVPGGDIRNEEVARELRACDMLLGCVDRDWPRLILSEISVQYLLPYLDLGTEITAENDLVRSLDARVSLVTPGYPCLTCAGIVSEERIRLEGLAPDEQERVLAMGYSRDIRLQAPAVMELNMRAASLAMLVVRHLLQPFLDTPLPTSIRESVTNYKIRTRHDEGRPECSVCGSAGRWGLGDSGWLTIRSAAVTV